MREVAQNNTMTVSSVAGRITENDPEDLKPVTDCCEPAVDFSNPRAYLLGVLASFAIVGIYKEKQK